MTRILIHTDAPQRHIASLSESFPDVQIEGCQRNSDLPGKLEKFRPDILFTVNITSDAPFPRAAILASETLDWVAVAGSGTDHIAPWDADKLTVTNAAGVAAGVMSEFALAAFLHFNLDIPGIMADQSARHWESKRKVRSVDGKTLLVVGLGHTGRMVAERAKALGMTVIGTRANPRKTPFCDEVHAAANLPQLWHRADFIAICTPGLPSTRGLVDSTALSLMKPDAVLVNLSRGGVVDETALRAALTEGRLRGAAMDVFETEPLPADNPIWDAPRLLISPHCSAVHDGWENAAVRLFSANLARRLAGEPLENIVDPKRGY
ncbi:D-2-hydroxyacid dehydrogenase [Aliishimia ponticola]|nr:D-2-hydroxyacid dehydrogenase [Aliishimia ponticola]